MSIEMKIPAVGESITEVTLSKWIKNNGDYVQMDEIIAELESDKATFELTAEKAGVLITKASEGDTIAIGSVVCAIDDKAAAPAKTETPQIEKAATTSAPVSETKKSNNEATYASGHPSPAAAKILSEKGIDAQAVKGSGIDGRITKEDAQAANTAAPKSSVTNTVTPVGTRAMRSEKMSSLRKTVAKRLVAVKNETAMLTTFNEVDMTRVMEVRKQYKDKFKEKHGVGLGFMSFFTKAVCEALKDFPSVNARIEVEEIEFDDSSEVDYDLDYTVQY